MGSPYATGRDPVEVAIKINGYTGAKYGFTTNHAESEQTTFGHAKAANEKSAVAFGANLPVPPRASIQVTGGTFSSYFDWDKYQDLRNNADARLSPGRFPIPTVKYSHARIVYVEYKPDPESASSIKYAWRMPNWQWSRIQGEATALGIKEAGAGDALWFGIDRPKPDVASKKGDGDTTYVGTTAQLTENWSRGGSSSSVRQYHPPF